MSKVLQLFLLAARDQWPAAQDRWLAVRQIWLAAQGQWLAVQVLMVPRLKVM